MRYKEGYKVIRRLRRVLSLQNRHLKTETDSYITLIDEKVKRKCRQTVPNSSRNKARLARDKHDQIGNWMPWSRTFILESSSDRHVSV